MTALSNPHLLCISLPADVDVKWPVAVKAMQCLMHHKFLLIDAEVSGDDSDDDDEENASGSSGVGADNKCPQCDAIACDDVNMASDKSSSATVPQCIKCRPLRIRSKEDLLNYPSDCLPRLPKNGLLITGSHNFSTQVRMARRRIS